MLQQPGDRHRRGAIGGRSTTRRIRRRQVGEIEARRTHGEWRHPGEKAADPSEDDGRGVRQGMAARNRSQAPRPGGAAASQPGGELPPASAAAESASRPIIRARRCALPRLVFSPPSAAGCWSASSGNCPAGRYTSAVVAKYSAISGTHSPSNGDRGCQGHERRPDHAGVDQLPGDQAGGVVRFRAP